MMFLDWYACPRRGTPRQISARVELPVSEYNNRPRIALVLIFTVQLIKNSYKLFGPSISLNL